MILALLIIGAIVGIWLLDKLWSIVRYFHTSYVEEIVYKILDEEFPPEEQEMEQKDSQ